MNDNPFEIKEEACASSPDHRRYLLIQAVDTETGEIVWAVGDDQICAVTRADFIRTPEIRYGDAFESMYILAKGKPKTVHILKDKPNKWAGTKTWGCLTKREVNGTLTPKGRKTIQKFGARTNVWHYGTVLPMESELFGGKAVSLSERLAEDHIRTWSNEGDLVLAPFDKDGTVAKIAPLLERRWLSLQNAADCDGLRDNAG